MIQLAHGWELDVERGPDWLFVRPHGLPQGEDQPDIALHIWSMLNQNFTNRLVLELDQVDFLNSYLIGQLVWLYKRIHAQGGLMRLCGLSATNADTIRACRLDSCFPAYANRGDAVMGHRPQQPR